MSQPVPPNTGAAKANELFRPQAPADKSGIISRAPQDKLDDLSKEAHQPAASGFGGLIGGFAAGASGLLAAFHRWAPSASDAAAAANGKDQPGAAAADEGKQGKGMLLQVSAEGKSKGVSSL